MQDQSSVILVADIGGTHARFAVRESEAALIEAPGTFACADYPQLVDAIDDYLKHVQRTDISECCFAVAGPIQDGKTDFLNNNWSISESELEVQYSLKRATLINDFVAVAYALPALVQDQLVQLGHGQPQSDDDKGSYCVIGPGSGLGIAGMRYSQSNLIAIETEGGHAGFAPCTALQLELLSVLQTRFSRVSNERLISGPGIENLHWALGEINDVPYTAKTAAEITSDLDDPLCLQAIDVFFEVLGQVAGDTVLSLGAFDGAYLAGGIAPRLTEELKQSRFRAGFENKGRYTKIMRGVPSYLITHKHLGLLGASRFAGQNA